MLNSLYIRNYRCLKDFKINRLGRINLLTGKNNTGKSSILEAIAIYASNGDPKELFKILEEHNENFLVNSKSNKENNKPTSNIKQNFLNSLANLFSGRKIVFDDTFSIYIGQNRGIFDINNEISGKSVILGFSIFKEVFYPDNVIKKEKVNFDDIDNLSDRDKSNLILDFEINSTKEPTTFILDSDHIVNYFLQDSKIKENFQLVRSNNVEKKDNPKLFDNIALTDKEQYVIEALKIIEPNIERITFVDSDSSLDRIAVIKLAGSNNTIPLKSMGDGINRILTIILAMVNAENGYLLIDEFENGLHYTSQIKLWEIIFKLAEKLNVQVFATTHSEDCIFGFERILNSIGNKDDGLLIRLDKKGDEIKYTEFDSEELRIANEGNIEIR